MTTPTPRVISYNLNGFSKYYSSSQYMTRYIRHLQNIRFCTKYADIICLIDTRIHYEDKLALTEALPGWEHFYNNHPGSSSAGTTISISPKYSAAFSVSHDILEPGRIQAVHFSHKKGNAQIPQCIIDFTVVNCYITAEMDFSMKKKQLLLLKRCKHQSLKILVGDWNFIEREEDTNTDSVWSHTPRTFLEFWSQTCQDLGLKEVFQEHHTRTQLHSTELNKSVSARLDRVYINYTEADFALFCPTVSLPGIPYPRNSDHLPIKLEFFANHNDNKTPFQIPAYIAKSDDFKQLFLERWQITRISDNAFSNLHNFKKVAISAARKALKMRKQKLHSPMSKIHNSIAILRELSKVVVDHEKVTRLVQKDPGLNGKIEFDFRQGRFTTTGLRKQLEELVREADKDVGMHCNGPKKVTYTEFLRKVQTMTPSRKTRMPFLYNESGQIVSEPQLMGLMAHRHYTRIWREPKATPKDAMELLLDYPRKLPTFPTRMDAATIEKCIKSSNNSAPGLDGVPFAVYRKLQEIATPLLLAVTRALEMGQVPPTQFNHGKLFTIPKKTTYKIEDTRPISIPNADNRIISQATRIKIQEVIKSWILPEQRAFIEGRRIEQNIIECNQWFYEAATRTDAAYLALVDFEKAYDNLSHDFLIRLLSHIGLPEYTVNVIKGLLTNLAVTPVYGGTWGPSIVVQRGVKQGCPLSTTLFVIAMDPLVTMLKGQGLKVWAFADDIAVALTKIQDLKPTMVTLQQFCTGTDMKVNELKTMLVPTAEPAVVDTKWLEESPWKTLGIVDESTYLGIAIGRNLSDIGVFSKAMEKLRETQKAFEMLKTQLPLDQKVIIANVFILPVLSYVYQFYLIPTPQLTEVAQMLRKFLIAHTQFKLECLHFPTEELGLRHPLKDLELHNVAAMCHEVPGPGEWHHMDIRSHWQRARKYFEIVVGDVTPGKTRKIRYEQMMRAPKLQSERQHEISRKVALLKTQGNWLTLLENWKQIPRSVPEIFRVHAIKMVYNALPTKARTKHFLPKEDLKCILCGSGIDSIQHLFDECRAIKRAWYKLKLELQLELEINFPIVSLLESVEPIELIPTLLCFSFTVWRVRGNHVASTIGSIETAACTIASLTLTNLARLQRQARATRTPKRRKLAEGFKRKQVQSKESSKRRKEESVKSPERTQSCSQSAGC